MNDSIKAPHTGRIKPPNQIENSCSNVIKKTEEATLISHEIPVSCLIDKSNVTEIQVSSKRLTCCIEWSNGYITSGYDGVIYYIDKNCKTTSFKICDSIIRCINLFDNSLLIGNDRGELILFDLTTKKISNIQKANSSIYCITKVDHFRFVTGEKSGEVFEWQFTNRKALNRVKLLTKAKGVVFAIRYDQQASSLCIADSTGEKISYSFLSGSQSSRKIGHTNIFTIANFYNNNIYGFSDGKIVLEYENRAEDLIGHDDAVRIIKTSQGFKWLLSGSKDGTIKAWNLNTKNTYLLVKSDDYIYDICLSHDMMHIFIADGTGICKIINLAIQLDAIDVFEFAGDYYE